MRRPRAARFFTSIVFAIAAGPIVASAQLVPMRLLHEFPDGFGPSAPGDSNHNGKAEIHCLRFIPPNQGDYDVYERRGVNGWTLLSRRPVLARIDDAGDSDRDGRFELLQASVANGIEVYESVDSESLPSQIVYTNPGIGFFQSPAKITNDLDGDGRREILWTVPNVNTLAVVILENTGDNTYEEVARPTYGGNQDYPGYLATGDLDGDGLGDIVTGDSGGNVYVIENRGDDTYALVWQTSLAIYPLGEFAVLGDADGDGLLEFATETLSPPRLWVFESGGDDQYEVVSSTPIPLGGNQTLRAADVDGNGRNDLIVGVGGTVQIWRAIANDTWEMTWEAPASGRGKTNTLGADLNNNGFAEVLYTAYPNLDRAFLVEWPWRVDASQNDLDRPADAIFNIRNRAALDQIQIRADGLDVTSRLRSLALRGNPHVSVTHRADETFVRLDLPRLGILPGQRVHLEISARDPQTGETHADAFDYVAP